MGDGDNGDVPGDVGVSATADGSVVGDAGFGGIGAVGDNGPIPADVGLDVNPFGNLADMGFADIGGIGDTGISAGVDGSIASGVIGIPDMVDPSMTLSKGLQGLLGMLGIPTNPSQIAMGMLGQPIGLISNIASMALGVPTIGQSIAAVPAMSAADAAIASANNSNPSNAAGERMNFGPGDAIGGLMSLYNYNQANQAFNGAINGLGGQFGQNSPYAQQLRQQLSRRDAAAGRRSQYGPREVELQAKLAQMNSQNAPAILNARMAQQKMRAQGLAQLYGLAQKSGLLSQIPGLSSIFGGGQDQGMGMDFGNFGGGYQAPSDLGFGGAGFGGYDMGTSDLGDYGFDFGG